MDEIIIDSYKKEYSRKFKELNLAWIQEFFTAEDEDLKSLEHPELYFINKGGDIFFAIKEKLIIGTAAMAYTSKNRYELAKMAVQKEYQGKGVGKLLIRRCIDFAKQKEAKEIFLITNDSLKPALNLYLSCGFVVSQQNDDNRYERGNTKMTLSIEKEKYDKS